MTAPRVDQRHRVGADEWAEEGLWVRVKSSNVAGIAYDKGGSKLYVEFKGVHVYEYTGVPEVVAKSMFNCDSMGKYVHTHLKNKYPFTKVN